MIYMEKNNIGEKLNAYVKNGGTLVTTVMSGLADENDRCVFGAYPGKLKDMLGIWVEETDALRPYEQNHMKIEKADMVSEEYSCDFLCDIHPEGGAEVLATMKMTFMQEFHRDMAFGKIKALLYWNSARTEISGRTGKKI